MAILDSGFAPLVQGAHRAVQAYSRASDAYAADRMSVAFWVLLIAAGLVLVEWLASRYRGRR